MRQGLPYRIILLTSIVLITGVLFSGCSTEVPESTHESDLRYAPFGDQYVLKSLRIDASSSLVALSDYSIALISGKDAKIAWRSQQFFDVDGMVRLGDKGYLICEQWYDNVRAEGITLLNPAGEVIQTSSDTKLFPEEPNLHEDLVSAVSDGSGGAYLLYVLTDDTETIAKRFLLHFNTSLSIDQKIQLTDFYVYMTADEAGNLYLIRTTSPEGSARMTLEARKVDRAEFQSGSVDSEWTYNFISEEPDWKWKVYFPFRFFHSLGDLFIIMQHNTPGSDLSDGVQILQLDATNGLEENNILIDIDFEVNNYLDQQTFEGFADEDGIYVLHNFGSSCRLDRFTRSGSPLDPIYLSGKSGRAEGLAIGNLGNRLAIHGVTYLDQSLMWTPFILLMDKP
ncbi:MAG: hypothetical protein KDC76_11490 [Bacteroidetes bacterium]|nr:hypothetical protein [Bacteroidota bacterium]